MTFIDFARVMKNDPELTERFKTCTNLEDAYAVATGAGLTIPFEEFSDYMNKISKVAVELSDEDVEAISAGCGYHQTAAEITFKVLEGVTSMCCV